MRVSTKLPGEEWEDLRWELLRRPELLRTMVELATGSLASYSADWLQPMLLVELVKL